MDKIAGKIFFVCSLLFLSFFLFAESEDALVLTLVNTDGISIEQACVRQPFVLEVSLSGNLKNSERPNILGIEKFHVAHTGFQMTTINGVSQIKYLYTVSADQCGEYVIGPAEVEFDGKTIRSNALQLKISDKEITRGGMKEKSKKSDRVFFYLYANKESVVIGEKIACGLRFYCEDQSGINLERIVSPEVNGFKQTTKEGPFSGSRKINGITYNFVEWRWNVFIDSEGEKVFPSYRADITVPLEHGTFGGFSSFFRFGNDQKYIYSNALTFNVEKLPEYKGVVDAVGNFTHFATSIDRAVSREGDGMVLTLELSGEGDLENLEISELSDMPSGLKYYDSKRYIVEKNNETSKGTKRFEFIVQGIEPGNYMIPSQTFTYFEPQERMYKTLKTEPLTVSILKDKNNNPAISNSDADTSDSESSQIESLSSKDLVEKKDEIRPIIQYTTWYKQWYREIPFWVFLLLIFLPFFVCLGIFAKNKLRGSFLLHAPYLQKLIVFFSARKKLKKASRQNDAGEIYSIFMQLFMERLSLKKTEITQEFILQLLNDKGFSKSERSSWELFWSKVSSFVFYNKNFCSDDDKNIFDQAISWVNKLSKKL